MRASVRFVLAAKGAVIWVLLACLLGIVPALIESNDATLSIPWVAAAMGLAGAVGHITVSLAKPHPEYMWSTALATAAVSSSLALASPIGSLACPPFMSKAQSGKRPFEQASTSSCPWSS